MLDILPRGSAPVHVVPQEAPSGDDSEMFELAPVSLWLEHITVPEAQFPALTEAKLRNRPNTLYFRTCSASMWSRPTNA